MKRIAPALAVAMLTIVLVVVSLSPALANHTPAHTQRQITQLQKQVTSLQRDVKNLRADLNGVSFEVFRCEFFDNTVPKTFPDGSVGFPLYEDSTCTT